MVKIGGYGEGTGYTPDQFYTTSRTTISGGRSGSTTRSRAGESKYASPEAEAYARPYADLGKIDVNLLDTGGQPGYRMPTAPTQTFKMPDMPGAEEIIKNIDLPVIGKLGPEANVPFLHQFGNGLDFLSNIAGRVPVVPSIGATDFANRLARTPDAELTSVERQIKNMNQGLFADRPDSPMMQAKQIAEMYKAYQIADAHDKGSSAQMFMSPTEFSAFGATPLGALADVYGKSSNLLRRGFGSIPKGFFASGLLTDQFQEVTKEGATVEEIGEERWEIRKAYEAGLLNEEEVRDLIAMSSFALSNPNPVKFGDEWGPTDTIANIALALGGEFITDPLSIPGVIATGGGYLAKAPISATLSSVSRSVAKLGLRGAAEAAGMGIEEFIAGPGDAAFKSAIDNVIAEATERASVSVASQAESRWLPRHVTSEAKRLGRIATKDVSDMDRLEALLDMGADSTHAWAPAIREGVRAAGTAGTIAYRAPKIIKISQMVDKMVDPFSLFGYTRTGRVVEMTMAKQGVHGFFDAIGWRVMRRLDGQMKAAGIDQELVDEAESIAVANHMVQAGDRANTARSVAMNSGLGVGGDPVKAAIRHVERREAGDLRRLVKDQVDRTLEYILPAVKGGMNAMKAQWRERAKRQLMDFGATEERAAAIASQMEEREMRGLANRHWGRMIKLLDEAKTAASPTAKYTRELIERISIIGPRQMTQAHAKALAVAIAEKNVDAVRAAVHRFQDLSQHISESLTDAEILEETARVLRQLDNKLPVNIEDAGGDLPDVIKQFLLDHPDYELMLSPSDLVVPIRDADNIVTGMHTWLANVTTRTPKVKVTWAKAQREALFRGITGGEIERNAARRFATAMARDAGLSEDESMRVLRSIREVANLGNTAPRGLTADSIYKAVAIAKVSRRVKNRSLAGRTVIDALLEAYENEMALVGVLPKATGWVKKKVSPIGGNAVGWATDYLYGSVRFTKNLLFFLQEVPEAPFFLALMGRYPAAQLIPQWAADIAPGAIGRTARGAKENLRVWNDKTLTVMDRMTRTSPNAEHDMFEIAELIRMGYHLVHALADPTTRLGGLLKKLGHTSLNVRKRQSLAIAVRREYGEQWRRALQKQAPEQWAAVRAYYPQDMSDGEVAIQWLLDAMTRSDPDGIYSILSPEMYRPNHIGKRAEVSELLVRHFVYGENHTDHTWGTMIAAVRDGSLSIDQVRRDLMDRGADPDYIERVVTKLTFGTADDFYAAAIEHGISPEAVGSWRASSMEAAARQGISEDEYLARRFVGKPLAVDQMGTVVGDTLFDDVIQAMKTAGKPLPDSGSGPVVAMSGRARDMITEVIPTDPRAPIPKGQKLSPNRARARQKALRWHKVRDERAADPTLHQPPTRRITTENPHIRGTPVVVEGEELFLRVYVAPEMNAMGESFASVRVHDKDTGAVIAHVNGNLNHYTGRLHTSFIEVNDTYRRLGIADWMYREWEAQAGGTIEPSNVQLTGGMGLWSAVDRPFGPPERTHLQTFVAFGNGRPGYNRLIRQTPEGEVVWGYDTLRPFSDGNLPPRTEDPYNFATWEPDENDPINVDTEGRILDDRSNYQFEIAAAKRQGFPMVIWDWPPVTPGLPRSGVEMSVSRMRPEIGKVETYADVVAARNHPDIKAAHEHLPSEVNRIAPVLRATEVLGRYEGGSEPTQVIHLDPRVVTLRELDKASHYSVHANEQDAVVSTIRGQEAMDRMGVEPNGQHIRMTEIPEDQMDEFFEDVGTLVPMGTIDDKMGSLDISMYDDMLDDTTMGMYQMLADKYGATFSAEPAHIRWYWRDAETQRAARKAWFSGPRDTSFNGRSRPQLAAQPSSAGVGRTVPGGEGGPDGEVQGFRQGRATEVLDRRVGPGGGYGGGLPTPPVVVATPPLYQSELHTIGPMSPRQYRTQIETMMDPNKAGLRGMRALTAKDVDNGIMWYDHMRRAVFALVDDSLTGEDRIIAAARYLISFGTTQLNTSPTDGWRHVFKAVGMKARGERLQVGEARNILQQQVGLNPEQLDALIWGDASKIEQMGIAQKLFDFLDSLAGSDTRTNGIRGPEGRWGPVAVDVHTKRDFGYLDESMGDWVYRLVERQGVDGELVRGISSERVKGTGFVIKMSDGTTEVIDEADIGKGVPTDGEYDYGVEFGNAVTDYFNASNFMGRRWKSYEVQALGWLRMQWLKSSEGDLGAVTNAMFEQSRWLGSNDLVPNPRAPIREVYPWDELNPVNHAYVSVEHVYHAVDEAEMLTGVRVLTRTASTASRDGVVRPSQTVTLLTDDTGAEQMLANSLLLTEADSGVTMRDYTGKTKTPKYDKGVGISLDIVVPDQATADALLPHLTGIGPHSFVAQSVEGDLVIRTLWWPGGNRNAFNKALAASGIESRVAQHEGASVGNTLVDFIRLENDWKARPDGGAYRDVILRGSGKHGVMRSPEQRAALIGEYDARYVQAQQVLDRANRMRDSNPKKEAAVKAADKRLTKAKKEHEVARAAASGPSEELVSQLVDAAHARVRDTVDRAFNRVASREVRHARERALGEARDASPDLGTDPTWESVLDRTRGSNGERLHDRTPGGTVRAAITRSDSDQARSQLFFNKPHVNDKSVLHELIHQQMWDLDDSAVRVIKGLFADLEGTPYGTHVPGTPLTEAEHEWLVGQVLIWMENGDAVHPVLEPLIKHFAGKVGAMRTLRKDAYAPAREAIKRIDTEIATLEASKAGKTARQITTINRRITAKQGEKAVAEASLRDLKTAGGLHPDVEKVLDALGEAAAKRTETRVSTFHPDEQNMLEWAQIAMAGASRRSHDLVHMRSERSAVERSLNHPFLGLYPLSYMYGKVLPHMAEFLMFRPFGMKAPFLAYSMGQHMNQSFERQQQYDEELRNFLYKNEPFLRAMSIFVPGLPWDVPTAFPFWARRLFENWMGNQVRAQRGQKPVDLDVPKLILDSGLYQLTLRGPDSYDSIIEGVQRAPEIADAMLTGEVPEDTGAQVIEQPGVRR